MKKIFLTLFALLISGNLFAAGVNEIVFFGDSLSDNGNLYKIFQVIPRSPPYFDGRFSNGPTWAETVGNHYRDVKSIPYSIYAYGGATALPHDDSGGLFEAKTLASELDEFYKNTAPADISSKLYVVWIGSNDYLWDDLSDADALTERVINSVMSGLNGLKDQGAKYFLILNLPDLSQTPYAKLNGVGERLHLLSEMHNQKLTKALASFGATNPDMKIITFDSYGILNDLLANPDKFNQKYKANFKVLDQSCWQGGITLTHRRSPSQKESSLDLQKLLETNKTLSRQYNTRHLAEHILSSPSLNEAYRLGKAQEEKELEPCEKPDQYVFWDQIHPTAIVHQILSEIAMETLEVEAKDWLTR